MNLIMTDYCMPGMTGYDFLKIVKVLISAVFCMSDAGDVLLELAILKRLSPDTFLLLFVLPR